MDKRGNKITDLFLGAIVLITVVNNATELSRARKTFGDVIESRGRRGTDRTVSVETSMEQLLWKLLNVVKLSAVERIKESRQPVLRETNLIVRQSLALVRRNRQTLSARISLYSNFIILRCYVRCNVPTNEIFSLTFDA